MAPVSAATGALGPVLAKLTALLGDENSNLEEGSRSDAMLIKSELAPVYSLLPRMWGIWDLDAACKDWMVEVRELSYDMEDAIDDMLELSNSKSPCNLKAVMQLFNEKRGMLVGQPSHPSPTAASRPAVVVVDPRARFLHKDASELVGMDKHQEELIKLLEQGACTTRDASRWRKSAPHGAFKHVFSTGVAMKQKITIKVAMASDNCRLLAFVLVATVAGVHSLEIVGDAKDNCVVVGEGIDTIQLVSLFRKKLGHSHLISVEHVPQKKVERDQQFHKVKTVCILGFAGGGKTTLAGLSYHAIGEQFQSHAFVSVSPNPDMTQVLRAILTEVTNAPTIAANGAAPIHELIDTIANFLVDKRYLIVIDNIWRWEEWEIIKKCFPKNNQGSRVIMTTRLNAIAEKCRTDDDDAFVYELGALDVMDAWSMSVRAVKKSLSGYSLETAEINTWLCILDVCYGMPLALTRMSLALAEQIQVVGRGGKLQKWEAMRSLEDGILDIPSLKPLAESLRLGFDDLPLYLRTFLLYCSMCHWHDRFQRGRLVRMWIAEGLVYGEEAAGGYFDELVEREWIKPLGGSKYGIHPMMLAFLRCKSQEENFATCLGSCSDIQSFSKYTRRRVRRLFLQNKYPVDCFSKMDLSHARSLVVFGDTVRIGVPLKQFERLRVLDLEDSKDIENAHLLDFCQLLWLRYLGLRGTKISELPPQIGKLKHLQTLDVRNTRVRELPLQSGQISKSLGVLAGDTDSEDVVRLPEEISQDLIESIPEILHADRNKVLSIAILDRFGPPLVATFKVPGTHIQIPQMIKNHFGGVLTSLDIRLCQFDDDDQKFLSEMPNLQTLLLRFEAPLRKPVRIIGKGFAVLESFRVDSRVPRVTFNEGAMPKLKHLEFKFYAGPASEDPAVGIARLRSVAKVVFRCSSWYSSDAPGISATIAVVRKEAEEHPNRISIWINDREEILEAVNSTENAGTSGIDNTESLCADRDSIAGKQSTFRVNSYHASCSRTSEIEIKE